MSKKSRLGSSLTHHGLDPGAGQTRLRGSVDSNKALRSSGPAAGGYPRCGAEAGSFRWEESPPCGNWRIILLLSPMLDGGTARLAAKGGAGRGIAFAAGKQSMERLRASAVTPAAGFAFRRASVFAYFLRSKSRSKKSFFLFFLLGYSLHFDFQLRS